MLSLSIAARLRGGFAVVLLVVAGLAAVAISRRCRGAILLGLALAVLVHQALVASAGCLVMGVGPALRGLALRIPGILLQVLGGWAVLNGLQRLRSREAMSR